MATPHLSSPLSPAGMKVPSLRRTLFIAVSIKLVLLAGLAWTMRVQRASQPPAGESLANAIHATTNDGSDVVEVRR